jgi:hypothetical protein
MNGLPESPLLSRWKSATSSALERARVKTARRVYSAGRCALLCVVTVNIKLLVSAYLLVDSRSVTVSGGRALQPLAAGAPLVSKRSNSGATDLPVRTLDRAYGVHVVVHRHTRRRRQAAGRMNPILGSRVRGGAGRVQRGVNRQVAAERQGSVGSDQMPDGLPNPAVDLKLNLRSLAPSAPWWLTSPVSDCLARG